MLVGTCGVWVLPPLAVLDVPWLAGFCLALLAAPLTRWTVWPSLILTLASVSGSLSTRPEYIRRWRSAGISANSGVANFALRSATVEVAGTVTTSFKSLEDLILKVSWVSSAEVAASSAMMAVYERGVAMVAMGKVCCTGTWGSRAAGSMTTGSEVIRVVEAEAC